MNSNTQLLLLLFQRYILLNIFIYGNIFSIKFIINNKSATIVLYCLLYLFFIVYLIFEYIFIKITKNKSTNLFKDIITQVVILLILLKSDLSINMKINIFLLIHNFFELFYELTKIGIYFNYNCEFNPTALLSINIVNSISVIQNIIFITYNIFQNYDMIYNLLYFIFPVCNFIFVFIICILYNLIVHYYYIIKFLYFTKYINNYNNTDDILIEIKSNINEDKIILLKKTINCFYCDKPNNHIYEVNQMTSKCLKCKKNNICMYFIDCDHHVACFDCCINM